MENNIERPLSVSIIKWILILCAIIQPVVTFPMMIFYSEFGADVGSNVLIGTMTVIFLVEVISVILLDKMKKQTILTFSILCLLALFVIYIFYSNYFIEPMGNTASIRIWKVYAFLSAVVIVSWGYMFSIRKVFIK